MKIVWNLTGDWLELSPTNQDLASYWIHSLDQSQKNVFRLKHNHFDLSWPSQLQTHICVVDDFLSSKLKITALSVFRDQDLVDQAILNDIHRSWIGLIRKYPNLVTLISRDSELHKHWNQINKKVHAIEEGFKSVYVASQYWETPNIFGTGILNFNVSQISLIFSQEGRSTFNKWSTFDYNIADQDTNDFLSIGTEVSINLRKPQTYAPPKEYVDFCNSYNIPVIGSTLNLANFSNFENKLGEIRHIYLRNIANENNTASFKL